MLTGEKFTNNTSGERMAYRLMFGVSDSCLTTSKQFFSHMISQQECVTFDEDDDVHFVLDKNDYFDF